MVCSYPRWAASSISIITPPNDRQLPAVTCCIEDLSEAVERLVERRREAEERIKATFAGLREALEQREAQLLAVLETKAHDKQEMLGEGETTSGKCTLFVIRHNYCLLLRSWLQQCWKMTFDDRNSKWSWWVTMAMYKLIYTWELFSFYCSLHWLLFDFIFCLDLSSMSVFFPSCFCETSYLTVPLPQRRSAASCRRGWWGWRAAANCSRRPSRTAGRLWSSCCSRSSLETASRTT